MGRLVRIPPTPASKLEPARAGGIDSGWASRSAGLPPYAATEQDNYLVRIAKYVPAEVLAFSIFINAILDQAIKSGGKTAMMAGIPVMTIATIVLIAGTLFAPFFVWYVREQGDAWVTNAWVSFLAFPFWSYALGAVAFSEIRDGNLAAILLASFVVLSGLIRPPVPAEKRVSQAQEPVKEGPRLVDLGTAM